MEAVRDIPADQLHSSFTKGFFNFEIALSSNLDKVTVIAFTKASTIVKYSDTVGSSP